MPAGGVTVVGGAAAAAAIRRSRDQVVEAAQAAARTAAEESAVDARSLVPVATGALQAGIEVRGEGEAAEVGVWDVDYAGFVEFGTSDTAAQPFLRPAAESQRSRYVDRATQSVGDAVD